MPELPEVEIVRRSLARRIVRQRLRAVEVRLPKLVKNPVAAMRRSLVGHAVSGLRRRAKIVLIEFTGGHTLAVHLKMSGQLIWQQRRTGTLAGGGHPIPGSLDHLPNQYSHVIFQFQDGTLYFNDQRQFGYVRLFKSSQVEGWLAGYGFGPEPLEAEFTWTVFSQRLARRARTTIKAALLDQRVVAGLGNIYVDEALYAARIRPTRRVGSLTHTEQLRLFRAIPTVLQISLANNGTTFGIFRDADGAQGNMLPFLKAYGRDGQRCRRDGNVIVKMRVAGRGTHVCLRCQQ